MGTQATNLPSSSSAATDNVHRQWMLLAPYGECEAEGSGCFAAGSTTAAAAHNSRGHLISVSLRLAPPPAMSRVHVRFPKKGVYSTFATVMAAHGDSLLIYVVSTAYWTGSIPWRGDYFVYDAGATKPPSLSPLPWPAQRWPRPNISATGLLRRGEAGEFVVAELKMVEVDGEDNTSTAPKKAAELLMFRSGEWHVKRPRINRRDQRRRQLPPPSWETKATVPLSDGLLCWVDDAHGAIFSDVFEESPVLRYVPFPAEAMNPRQSCHSYLCITTRGTVNLVNMSPRCCSYCGCSTVHDHDIHTWTLKTDDMAWVRETMEDATELWDLGDVGKGIARIQLVYSGLSMNNYGPVIADGEEDDAHKKYKGKKRQVDDESARPRRSRRIMKRNAHGTGPD